MKTHTGIWLCLTIALAAGCSPEGEQRYDFDGDGWEDSVDCDPDDPSVHPGAKEECGDGIDNNCDGRLDEWDSACNASVSSVTGWAGVSAGGIAACAVHTDGDVTCWGDDTWGQLDVPTGAFVQVDAGLSHGCAIQDDGALVCWGCQGYVGDLEADVGQCTPPSGEFMQVSAGGYHSCAVDIDGAVQCWGCGGERDFGQCDAPEGDFTQVSAGMGVHNCALRTDGEVVCWGFDLYDTLTAPTGLYTDISSGIYGNCAVGEDGTLACWGCDAGDNDLGQCDPPAGTYLQVSAQYHHGCAVDDADVVHCWGDDGSGQADVPPLDFRSVVVGMDFSCARMSDGTVVCWEAGDAGLYDPP